MCRYCIGQNIHTLGFDRTDKIESPEWARRVALACALLHDPRLLLLDEPTRDMERQERVALWDLLFALRTQGKTILLTTQDWEEACTLCDRVAHLSQGKLRAVGEQAFWAKSEQLLIE